MVRARASAQLADSLACRAHRSFRGYHAGPSRFGRYDLLDPSSAMTTFPDPRPVPREIARPSYVPANFFDAPWGDHDKVEERPVPEQEEGRIKLGTDEERRVRRSGRVVAEVLSLVGGMLVVRIGNRPDGSALEN